MRHWLLFGIILIVLFVFLARGRVSRMSTIPPPTTSPATMATTTVPTTAPAPTR